MALVFPPHTVNAVAPWTPDLLGVNVTFIKYFAEASIFSRKYPLLATAGQLPSAANISLWWHVVERDLWREWFSAHICIVAGLLFAFSSCVGDYVWWWWCWMCCGYVCLCERKYASAKISGCNGHSLVSSLFIIVQNNASIILPALGKKVDKLKPKISPTYLPKLNISNKNS